MIEMMMTLVILGILVALVLPTFSGQIARKRLRDASDAMLLGIATARSEAVKRAVPFTLCTSNDNTSCSGTGSWAGQGWVLISELTNDVVGVFDPVSGGITVTTQPATATNTLTFNPSGRISIGTGVSLTLCVAGQTARVITISASGRTKVGAGDECS